MWTITPCSIDKIMPTHYHSLDQWLVGLQLLPGISLKSNQHYSFLFHWTKHTFHTSNWSWLWQTSWHNGTLS